MAIATRLISRNKIYGVIPKISDLEGFSEKHKVFIRQLMDNLCDCRINSRSLPVWQFIRQPSLAALAGTEVGH